MKIINQVKEHMELYLNVKVNLIINIMQLKNYNNNKDKLILMKYKLFKIFKIIIIL